MSPESMKKVHTVSFFLITLDLQAILWYHGLLMFRVCSDADLICWLNFVLLPLYGEGGESVD